MEPDKETTDILSHSKKMSEYCAGDEWKYVKKKITDKIMDLQSIKNLENETTEGLIAEIKARNAAVDILMEVVKEIEGEASQIGNVPPREEVVEEYIVFEA